MYLLDTNVVSELRKFGVARSAENVFAWAASVDSGHLYLSSITVLELEIGVQRMERRDERQGAVLRTWLAERVRPAFSGRILPFDTDAAELCAGYHVPDPRPERDSLIAATAQAHQLTVVTRNVRDFVSFGVPILNPWDAV